MRKKCRLNRDQHADEFQDLVRRLCNNVLANWYEGYLFRVLNEQALQSFLISIKYLMALLVELCRKSLQEVLKRLTYFIFHSPHPSFCIMKQKCMPHFPKMSSTNAYWVQLKPPNHFDARQMLPLCVNTCVVAIPI